MAAKERFSHREHESVARAFNRRKREAYPADYDRTLAEHAAWKARQANAEVQALSLIHI